MVVFDYDDDVQIENDDSVSDSVVAVVDYVDVIIKWKILVGWIVVALTWGHSTLNPNQLQVNWEAEIERKNTKNMSKCLK